MIPRHRRARRERLAAEQRTAQVQAEVIRPLREMRARNHLVDAVRAEMRRRGSEI